MVSRLGRHLLMRQQVEAPIIDRVDCLGLGEASVREGLFQFKLGREWGAEIGLFQETDISHFFETDGNSLKLVPYIQSIVDGHGLLVLDNAVIDARVASFSHGTTAYDESTHTQVDLQDEPLNFHRDSKPYAMLEKKKGETRQHATFYSSRPAAHCGNIIASVESVLANVNRVENKQIYELTWTSQTPRIAIYSNEVGFSHASTGARECIETFFIDKG